MGLPHTPERARPSSLTLTKHALYTYTLPGGEISAQGVNAYPKLSEPAPRSVDAISGGTGKYAGVQGERRFETGENKVTNTFHFID